MCKISSFFLQSRGTKKTVGILLKLNQLARKEEGKLEYKYELSIVFQKAVQVWSTSGKKTKNVNWIPLTMCCETASASLIMGNVRHAE